MRDSTMVVNFVARISQKGFVCIQRYFYSLDSLWTFGLFNGAAAALVSHKIMMISLRGPLPLLPLFIATPCLFVFDMMTLVVLFWGLSSSKQVFRGLAALGASLVMVCSAIFASLFLEGKVELNWSQSFEVISSWKYFSKFLSRGYRTFILAFVFYTLVGASASLLRFVHSRTERSIRPSSPTKTNPSLLENVSFIKRCLAAPFFPFLIFLSVVTIFLPVNPWRRLTSTLAFDIVTSISTIIIQKPFPEQTKFCQEPSTESHLFDDLNYDSTQDPYYISNLHLPVDDFIASALKNIRFTNIVHIVLESMREDSYPYDEQGLLHQYIQSNMTPAENGTPVTIQTITPFIDSLAEHTLSWHTMWSTIPYTHKAMLGCIFPSDEVDVDWCGMLPLPVDWAQEVVAPAKRYQTCFPQVLRQMNMISDKETELMALFRNNSQMTTDLWETVHVYSSTGTWDKGKDIIKDSGFDAVITAEHLSKLNGGKQFPGTFGYFDDESLEYLWKYVDYASVRTPRNRLYLSWMTSTTHTPFDLPPTWEEKNTKSYLKKEGNSELWRLREHTPLDTWLNAVRWTDDNVKDIITGFRKRGLEKETLFIIHGDHGIPFLGEYRTPVANPHNEPYRVPFMIYNPRIKNPEKKKIEGNYYSLSIPTTILDLMNYTRSFKQNGQQALASHFMAKYEHSQSLLRPVNETMRFFTVDPGGGSWIVDNGRNLRCRFQLSDDKVRLVDYIADPMELNPMESWGGVEALIADGVEDRFGDGTKDFLREAYTRQEYMKTEIFRRYGLEPIDF